MRNYNKIYKTSAGDINGTIVIDAASRKDACCIASSFKIPGNSWVFKGDVVKSPLSPEMVVTKLKRKRVSLGMLQMELSYLANVSVSHLSRYERGWTKPSMPTKQKIADALKCEVSDIFDEEELDDQENNR